MAEQQFKVHNKEVKGKDYRRLQCGQRKKQIIGYMIKCDDKRWYVFQDEELSTPMYPEGELTQREAKIRFGEFCHNVWAGRETSKELQEPCQTLPSDWKSQEAGLDWGIFVFMGEQGLAAVQACGHYDATQLACFASSFELTKKRLQDVGLIESPEDPPEQPAEGGWEEA